MANIDVFTCNIRQLSIFNVNSNTPRLLNRRQTSVLYKKNHSFESARKVSASKPHLLHENDVNYGVIRCNVLGTLERRYKYT